jgi:hypothetical protein
VIAGFVFHDLSETPRLRAARAELAALRFQRAGLRLVLALKRNFNPSQPRVPAGRPAGGQWTRIGGVNGGWVQVAQSTGSNASPAKSLTETDVNGMKFASAREQVVAREAISKPFVLAGKGSLFQVSPNPSANSNAPLNEIAWLSGVRKFETEIEAASSKEKVDSDLIRTVVYMETTHGWYDAFAMGENDTILPMNVSVQNWGKALGLSRSDLEKPLVNIEAGAKILKGIIGNLPEKAPVSIIATLYNVLGAPQVNGYGARAQKIYQIKPWKK